MKRFFNILLVSLLVLSLALTAALAEGDHRVAKDGAQMQTDDPTMPTRVPMEGGTKILLHFGLSHNTSHRHLLNAAYMA